jgi:pimeloyl-ACP methyl ester carboxylesterase
MVDVDGHAMRVHIAGLDSRRDGSPVVVFEAGATNSLDVWGSVLPQVAAIGPVVAYDRAGLGRSTWDNEAPTPRHVANKLRRLLEQVGAKPPYVLVGYSWGGILARYFAGYHPGDVSGIVYVDPGPMVTQSAAEKLAPFDSVGAGRAGYDAFWASYATLFQRSPAAVRAEFDVFRDLMSLDGPDRGPRPVPDVPIVVILAAKYLPLPTMQLPYDPRAHFDVDLRQRAKLLHEWVLKSPRGTLVVSNSTTHAVPREDPDLIVWAVKRVLAGRPTRP